MFSSHGITKMLIEEITTIALVGASDQATRPSYQVMEFLLNKNYSVFPVNQKCAGEKILGQYVYASLNDISERIDMVDIFRRSDKVAPIVDMALMRSPLPKLIWMQIGVEDEISAQKARQKGVHVIMNKCPKIEYARLR